MKRFINTLIKEFGKEQAKQEFVSDIMERLDELSAKHGYTDIFHYTANEVSHDDENVLDFLNELDINSVEDNSLKQVLDYLLVEMKFETDQLPAELIGALYEELTNSINPWEKSVSTEKNNPWAEKIQNDKENEWER